MALWVHYHVKYHHGFAAGEGDMIFDGIDDIRDTETLNIIRDKVAKANAKSSAGTPSVVIRNWKTLES
jgi:hypothetical protein